MRRAYESIKTMLFAIQLASMLVCTASAALGEPTQPLPVTQRANKNVPSTPTEMLTKLRDFRLCLTQLRQQSTNLFQEATRTEMTDADKPVDHLPPAISVKMIEENCKYLPPRKEWLVFYINTMEPILQLLNADINEVEKEGHEYSNDVERKVNPLWEVWVADVGKINKSLDRIQELVGQDCDSNVPLAKEAITIHELALDLEKVRYQAAVIFRDELRKTAAKTD